MNSFRSNGYQIIKQLITPATVVNLRQAIADTIESQSDYGVRQLHHRVSLVDELANSELITNILRQQTNHAQFRLIKAIYFNKNARHNWSVPWHQDKTIAVRNKAEVPGFKNWTVKQGVTHVQPPLEVLAKITAIRIALDDTNASNGGLKILPRSHIGILNQTQINCITKQRSSLSLNMKAGDALMMHPLTLHSSNKSINHNPRRIIHLEYSSGDLPIGLTWY